MRREAKRGEERRRKRKERDGWEWRSFRDEDGGFDQPQRGDTSLARGPSAPLGIDSSPWYGKRKPWMRRDGAMSDYGGIPRCLWANRWADDLTQILWESTAISNVEHRMSNIEPRAMPKGCGSGSGVGGDDTLLFPRGRSVCGRFRGRSSPLHSRACRDAGPAREDARADD